MNKRILLAGLLGVFAVSNVCFASPTVHIKQGDIVADYSYVFSKNEETYKEQGWTETRSVGGHAMQYGAAFGLKQGYAVSLEIENYRYSTFNDGVNQYTTPSVDSIGVNLQKPITNNIAIYTGLKHLSGSWTYSNSAYTPATVTRNNSIRNVAVLGLVGETNFTKDTKAYVKIGAGYHLREYKIGVSYKNLDLGYGHIEFKDTYNPLFATANPIINGLDLTTKGFYVSVRHKI